MVLIHWRLPSVKASSCLKNNGGRTLSFTAWIPGHDQRLRADLERRVGGLIQLRMLVEAAEYYVAGDLGDSQFNSMVKDLFQNIGGCR